MLIFYDTEVQFMTNYKYKKALVSLGIWAGKIVIEKVVDSVVDSFTDQKKK